MKDITKIEKLVHYYNESSPKNSDIYVPVRVSYEPNFYHFSSQGRIFNEIFKDNLDYYEELIKGKHTGTNQRDGIKDLKRVNVTITMRSDD